MREGVSGDLLRSAGHLVWNLGEAPFSAEAPLVAGRSTKPTNEGVMEMGWAPEAG